MIFALIWLLQDFLQVFVMGIFIVPDIFLLSVVLAAVMRGGKEGGPKLVWAAFIGGLIWDLRWTNLPGLTAAVNGAVVAAVLTFWYKAPVQGRNTTLCALFMVLSQLLSGGVQFLFRNLNTQAALRQFAVQQLMSIPVLVIICIIFWKVESRDV